MFNFSLTRQEKRKPSASDSGIIGEASKRCEEKTNAACDVLCNIC